MKLNFSSVLKLILSLGFGVFLIWIFYSKLSESEIEQIKQAFREANYLWVGVSIIVGVLSHFSRALRWQMLLEAMQYKPKLHNTFFAVMVTYIANLAFPRLGEVLRCGVLLRYEEIPIQKSLGTMITERAVDLISLAILGFLTFALQIDVFTAFWQQSVAPGLNSFIANFTFTFTHFLILIALLVAGAGAIYFIKKGNAKGEGIQSKIGKLVAGMLDGIKSIKDMKSPFMFVIHSLVIWILYAAMVVVCFKSMEVTAHLGWVEGLSCLFFGAFAIIMVQGGIGAYPIVISSVLILYGIPETLGYAFGWLVWTGQTIMVLIFGSLSIALLPVMNNSKKVDSIA